MARTIYVLILHLLAIWGRRRCWRIWRRMGRIGAKNKKTRLKLSLIAADSRAIAVVVGLW